MPHRENRPKVTRSFQTRLTLGYAAIIASLLLLLNTYPLFMTQNQMFRSQQTTLQNQAILITNSLTTADELTAETVEQAIAPMDDLAVTRLLVTDEAGLVLYDTGEPSIVGQYCLTGEAVSALRGNDTFHSDYQNGVFSSRAASPIMTRSTVVGAVCLYAVDSTQGTLLQNLQNHLRLISLVVCLAVCILFTAFSRMLTRRVSMLLAGIRRVRAGEYTHRVTVGGNDEISQLAEEFNQLTGRLQTTEEERRRFVSDASHELKTPLASIRLLTDSILQDDSIDRATAMEFIGDIGEAADRLIHISQELLALNRLDEGRMRRPEPVAITERVEKTCRLLSPLAEQANVTLETCFDGPCPGETCPNGPCPGETCPNGPCPGEPGLIAPGLTAPGSENPCLVSCGKEDLDQILWNLVENAIKYNLPGGRVTVSTHLAGDAVRLEVADTGVGIPQEALSRVFERFYRVDKARSREAGGTGLGLSIVRDTVRLYGGRITAAPGAGGGMVFTVWLPLWQEEGEAT